MSGGPGQVRAPAETASAEDYYADQNGTIRVDPFQIGARADCCSALMEPSQMRHRDGDAGMGHESRMAEGS